MTNEAAQGLAMGYRGSEESFFPTSAPDPSMGGGAPPSPHCPPAEEFPGGAYAHPGKRSFNDAEVQRLADAYAESARGDEQAELRNALILQLAPLVESVARKFTTCAEPIEDLVGEGFIGLIQAVDGYECGRGAKFSTYATHRVAGQIKHYLRDRGKIIREPAWLQETTLRLSRAAELLQQELGRRPTMAEIGERTNLTEETVCEIFAHRNTFQVLPIDAGSGEDDDEPFAVDTERIRSQHYESLQLPLEDRILLEKLLGRLRELERRAVTAFFFQEFSQSDIARQLGISCNYAGHLLRNGIEKLRKWIQTDELREAQLAAARGASAPGAVVDPDTAFYNAGYFRSRLLEEIARARRFHHPLALVLLSIERPPAAAPSPALPAPRSPRGTPGRGARRQAVVPTRSSEPGARSREERSDDLKEVAFALRQCLRKADIPCRVGEHEFAIILPDTGDPVSTVGRRLQRLVSQILQRPVRCGTAIWPDAGTSADDLEGAARRAMEVTVCQA
jgi:RNA polymerase sigma-B factor